MLFLESDGGHRHTGEGQARQVREKHFAVDMVFKGKKPCHYPQLFTSMETTGTTTGTWSKWRAGRFYSLGQVAYWSTGSSSSSVAEGKTDSRVRQDLIR